MCAYFNGAVHVYEYILAKDSRFYETNFKKKYHENLAIVYSN